MDQFHAVWRIKLLVQNVLCQSCKRANVFLIYLFTQWWLTNVKINLTTF